jgi:phage terminase large subunit-like protein
MIPSGLEEVIQSCMKSTKVTAKVIFPERFYSPFVSLHNELFSVLDDDSIKKVVVVAARGIGKTSIMNLGYPAKKILFREKKFIVPISNTSTQAIMQSENLKRELLMNKIVRSMFGSVKTDKASEELGIDQSFAKDMWVALGNTLIFPRGTGQQVRGVLFNNYRPDLILCDDMEDAESVKSEEQRKKLKEWFFADVMNSVSMRLMNWKIVVMGTLLHEDSLLANLLEDPTWYHIRMELCDDDYNSNWPDFMSTEQIKEMFNGYRNNGMLDVAYREYRGLAISTEDSTFMQSYFHWYEESEERLDERSEIENVVIVDPAKTVKLHSDYSAVIGIGIDTLNGRLYIRDLDRKMFHPDELYKAATDMCKRLKARVLGVEVTSLNEYISYPLKNFIMKEGFGIELVELHARGKKEDRIAALVSPYRMGQIWHNKAVTQHLEEQLLSFPRSKKDDCMDAEAYVLELLEQGERYFLPSNVITLNKDREAKMNKEDREQVDPFIDETEYIESEWDSIIEEGSYNIV